MTGMIEITLPFEPLGRMMHRLAELHAAITEEWDAYFAIYRDVGE